MRFVDLNVESVQTVDFEGCFKTAIQNPVSWNQSVLVLFGETVLSSILCIYIEGVGLMGFGEGNISEKVDFLRLFLLGNPFLVYILYSQT